MKLLQKLAAVGMAACMLFSALSGQGAPSVKAYQIDSNAPDEEVAGIYADTIHAAAGETVPVSVSINNNDGFASVGASIIYPAALTPVAGSDAAKPEFEVGSQFSGWTLDTVMNTAGRKLSFTLTNPEAKNTRENGKRSGGVRR